MTTDGLKFADRVTDKVTKQTCNVVAQSIGTTTASPVYLVMDKQAHYWCTEHERVFGINEQCPECEKGGED